MDISYRDFRDPDETAHNELPYRDLRCLQIPLVLNLVL